MSLLLETLKLEDGELCNLVYHQRRFDNARLALFPDEKPLDLKTEVIVPESCKKGSYRCRISYRRSIEKIEISTHHIRTFNCLQTVSCEDIDYTFKYADRRMLEDLLSQRKGADDVLVIKNGFVTDTSIGNIALFDGTYWYTPVHCLLEGTKRQKLIEEKVIKVAAINYNEIWNFKKARILNCFYDLEYGNDILIENIRPLKE